MKYRQITVEERYTIGQLRRRGDSKAEIARVLGRHRSSIGRELARNRTPCDGAYRVQHAQWHTNARRRRSRRNRRFTIEDQALVAALLCEQWSPEQIVGYCRRHALLAISHETIYRWIWADWKLGGTLYQQLRGARRQRRKRYGTREWRGRVVGKRPIGDRPAVVERRCQVGHWEADTLLGAGRPCLLSMVERATGYVLLGKLESRTTAEVNRRAIALLPRERRPVRTITADNGTEFHSYAKIEQRIQARFYFATPHHAWERGTNENTNGLLRQYLPKGCCMKNVTQHDCRRIAKVLNDRPRKRLGFRTPEECYAGE
jgi:IS30 family transposase